MKSRKLGLELTVTTLLMGLLSVDVAVADFSDYEIRVIRPRFFIKRGKLELGTQFNVVSNQTFIYTFLASGIMTYHMSNSWALELSAAYGTSFDKDDKAVLKDEFDISTIILRTQYMYNAALLWAPMYGKYQLFTGKLIYFDTFLSLGAGATGIEYLYDHCPTNSEIDEDSPLKATYGDGPAPKTVGYPGTVAGVGQRFFISKKTTLRWDLRGHAFAYDTADGSCFDGAESSINGHTNLLLQFGISRFI